MSIVPLNPIPTDSRLYSNVAPFTARDNMTYTLKLEGLTAYINDKLVPFVNQNVSGLDEKWLEITTQLIADWNTQSTELREYADNAGAGADDAATAAQTAQAAAETAAALAGQFASDAEGIQDTAISSIVQNDSSVTRDLLDGLYASATTLNTLVSDLGTLADRATSNEDAISSVSTFAQSVNDKVDLIEGSTGPVLASYHLTNDYATYFALSSDGVNFEPNGVRFLPSDTAKATNPSIVQMGDEIWVTYGTTANKVGLAHSADGRNFTPVTYLNGAYVGELWAPDFFIDGDTKYVIFTNKPTGQPASTFKTFEMHTTGANLETAVWSTPVQLTGIPDGGIDHHIVKVGDVYHGFYTLYGGNSGQGGGGDALVYHATASSVAGPWTVLGLVDPAWDRAEGVATVRLADKPGYRMYLDSGGYGHLVNGSVEVDESVGGMFYADFNEDFSEHGPLRPVPLAMRHMGIIPMPSGNDLGFTFPRRSMNPAVAHMMHLTPSSPITIIDGGSTTTVAPGEVFTFNSGEKWGDIAWVANARTVPAEFTRVTIRESGLYMLSLSLYINGASGTDWITTCFAINGVKHSRWDRGTLNGNGLSAEIPAIPVYLNRDDYVQVVLNGSVTGSPQKRGNFCFATIQKVS